ncbi:hypothetical protein Agub_g15827, partial [Astrephomene gubernaculifera]
MQSGGVTWQLPLTPGPDALQPPRAPLPPLLAPLPGAPRAAAVGTGTGTAGQVTQGSLSAAEQAVALQGLARGGVVAMQFSPQADHLAALVLPGYCPHHHGSPASCPPASCHPAALLVFPLRLPWGEQLRRRLPGGGGGAGAGGGGGAAGGAGLRPALMVQPCRCWLLPGLRELLRQRRQQARQEERQKQVEEQDEEQREEEKRVEEHARQQECNQLQEEGSGMARAG